MRGVIIVLMAILGVIFPKFLVKAIKSTDRNDADGGLLGSQINTKIICHKIVLSGHRRIEMNKKKRFLSYCAFTILGMCFNMA